MWFYKPKLAYHSVKANSEFSFSEKKGGSFGNRVMRPTIKDANFHFSYAHSAIFSLPFTEKIKRGPFHFTEETLIFWFSGSANFSLPITIEITMGLGCPVWVLWVPAIGLGVP